LIAVPRAGAIWINADINSEERVKHFVEKDHQILPLPFASMQFYIRYSDSDIAPGVVRYYGAFCPGLSPINYSPRPSYICPTTKFNTTVLMEDAVEEKLAENCAVFSQSPSTVGGAWLCIESNCLNSFSPS
jgi:hypothetical protein